MKWVVYNSRRLRDTYVVTLFIYFRDRNISNSQVQFLLSVFFYYYFVFSRPYCPTLIDKIYPLASSRGTLQTHLWTSSSPPWVASIDSLPKRSVCLLMQVPELHPCMNNIQGSRRAFRYHLPCSPFHHLLRLSIGPRLGWILLNLLANLPKSNFLCTRLNTESSWWDRTTGLFPDSSLVLTLGPVVNTSTITWVYVLLLLNQDPPTSFTTLY